MIKNVFAKLHIKTQPQDKYVYIPLRNDKDHRDMKYHRNTKKIICIYTCSDVNLYYRGSSVHDISENLELQ